MNERMKERKDWIEFILTFLTSVERKQRISPDLRTWGFSEIVINQPPLQGELPAACHLWFLERKPSSAVPRA